MSVRFQETLKKLRDNPETSRAGLKWDDGEDDKMIAKVKDGISIDEIAKELKRTPGSIKTRVIMNAINDIDNKGVDADSILKEYKINQEDINDYLDKKKQRDERQQAISNMVINKSVNNPTIRDTYFLLREVANIVNEIRGEIKLKNK
eukprot:762478-Hanusia_phi.AAC.11